MIIVVGGIKGGSGKTTLATNLAVMRANDSKKVMLIDADEQKSVTDWIEQREGMKLDSNWTTIQLSGDKINAQLLRLTENYDDIIVDVGGRDTTSQRSALSVADIFLVPFKPRALDIWTMGKVKTLISEVTASNPKMISYAIINQADSKGIDNEEAFEILKDCTSLKCFPFTIGYRKAFGNAATEGMSVIELKIQDKKATHEIRCLYESIYHI